MTMKLWVLLGKSLGGARGNKGIPQRRERRRKAELRYAVSLRTTGPVKVFA